MSAINITEAAHDYLADLLSDRAKAGEIDGTWLSARLPAYISEAIAFATTQSAPAMAAATPAA